MPSKTPRAQRVERHRRVRLKVRGTVQRPRLAVFRSLRHIYAQVIEDEHGVTLAAASSVESEVRAQRDGKPKSDVSRDVGALIARRVKAKGVTHVVFDRGGNKYHGRVKALAEAAREEGLTF